MPKIIDIVKGIFLLVLLIFSLHPESIAQGREYELFSPDENIRVTINLENQISYSVRYDEQAVLKTSPLSLTLNEYKRLGINPHLKKVERNSADEIINPVVQEKNQEIVDRYNEITLFFEDNYRVIFRAYNDGVAYRFVINFEDDIIVNSEEVEFNFRDNHNIYFPEEDSFMTHQERSYRYLSLEDITPKQFGSMPVLLDIENGPNVAVTEVDVEDYPGMYLRGKQTYGFQGIFPNVAEEVKQYNDRDVYVTRRKGYLAKTSGERNFPWRAIIIAEDDGSLIENQLVYKLAKPLQLKDTSWINPGKVAWDWWNANNISGVDFRAGVNSQTYKYYIDFAARLGLEYIILDEGWYELEDLTSINPEINIPELVAYGQEKGVGIILWVVWKTLDDQWETAFKQFEEWDIKGIKVDFMQRDDQWMVNYYWRTAKKAAEHQLLVNFHGSYKPTGLRRAYPNVVTREGVKGLEHNKWSEDITPQHNLTIPFIRMAAGPIDYTPGAMVNAQPGNFQAIYNRPMSQGTRVHQLAMYVVYESPLQMLADTPTNYLKQKKEILDYLSEVPVTWDKTKVIDASVGDYILMRRKKGDTWYVAAMNDENPRSLSLDLSFLEKGTHDVKIFSDGINADRFGSDYTYRTKKVDQENNLKIDMVPGGGWVAVFSPVK